MLSLVLWNAIVFCGFGFLRTRSTLGLSALPAILLVWVNTHGAFILAGRERRHAALAGLLCLGATAVTPYGWRYPVQLVRESLGGFDRPDIAWNNAFQPTFGAGQALHLPQLAALMTAILAGLA